MWTPVTIRPTAVFILLSVLLVAIPLCPAAALDEPAPPPPMDTDPLLNWEGDKPLRPSFPAQDTTAPAPVSATGAPLSAGPILSYRYLQTFGQTEVPYFDDRSHLNGPQGLTTDGTTVWIAEGPGRRAQRFRYDGSFQKQVGAAGVRYGAETEIEFLSDVAVDAAGDIWLVDRGAHHVVHYDSTGAYIGELGQLWRSGNNNNRFNTPSSIAFAPAGHILVSDTGNHRIQVFDAGGGYLATLGITGQPGTDNGHLNSPGHIVVDANSRLYVADEGNHRVQVLDISNLASVGHLATLGTSGQPGEDNAHLKSPQGVAFDLTRNRIYVADSGNNRVQQFELASGNYQASLALIGRPSDVAVDSAGSLYVALPDPYISQVLQFNTGLSQTRIYGDQRSTPYATDGLHYNQPAGLAVTGNGGLYVVEAAGQRLLRLNPDGTLRWSVGRAGRPGDSDRHFRSPQDVDLDGFGRAYVVDRDNCRVQIYDAEGAFVARLGKGCGAANNQFQAPSGVAIAPDGTVYVSDAGNQRIQIFEADLSYRSTLGQTGVAGSDNAHFDSPQDVAVDAAGRLYVADQGNHRVQLFSSSGTYLRTFGVSGASGDDLTHLLSPTAVAVDGNGHLFVGDQWGYRVQVFATDGAYLTTIGGFGGPRTGAMRHAEGLAVDAAGNLYIAERENHRIQKFTPGVPGWQQINLNGFGDRFNSCILSLAAFPAGSAASAQSAPAARLYATTYTLGSDGGDLWRLESGGWTAVSLDGFGDPSNEGINQLAEFGGRLYAGTWNWDDSTELSHGAQVWRSDDGTAWTQVVDGGFGDPDNAEVHRFVAWNNRLYAATHSYTAAHGTELWRSSTGNGGDWHRVVEDGFGDAHNVTVLAFESMGGTLYAGTQNDETGGELWRSSSGAAGTWAQVNTDGFGEAGNLGVSALAVFQGRLYASTGHAPGAGAELWSCQACDGSDWTQHADNGFGNPEARRLPALEVFDDQLYWVLGNNITGSEVWRSSDGQEWEQVGLAGFGDSNNYYPYWDNSVLAAAVTPAAPTAAAEAGAEGEDGAGDAGAVPAPPRLYVGTCNSANGAEIWKKALTAGFSASPARGPAPLTVQFTNLSGGDYLSAHWSFGDGASSNESNPSHTYAAGRYTVRLTIGDGVESDTVTQTILAGPSTYLPFVTRGGRSLP